MKSRKFDKKAIQAFFIDHGEKVIYGVVVLCALALIFLALSEKGYDKKPSDLTASIDNANHTIDATKPELPPDCFDPNLAVASAEIHADAYGFGPRLGGTLIITRDRREMPELFAVEALRATAGVGAFTIAVRNTPAPAPTPPRRGARTTQPRVDTGMRGEHFVVVTGLVPIEKQRNEYDRCFQKAQFREPSRDTPAYVGYFIERAEVSGNSLPDKPRWSPLALMSEAQMAADAKKRWTSGGGEVVAARYLDKALTCPLPPRKDHAWGSEVAHDPEIPLPSLEKPPTPDQRPIENPVLPLEKDPFAQKNVEPTQHMLTPAQQAAPQEKMPPYCLLRYFDFDVKPGHKYIYRVFPVLKNPNRDLSAAKLKDPGDAKKWFIGDGGSSGGTFVIDSASEKLWTMMPEVVAVPDEVQVLAQAVKVPPRAEEPTAEIRTITWLEEKGELAPMTQSDLRRGRLLDFPGCTYRPEMPTTGGRRPPARDRIPGTPIDYVTGQILVDMSPSRNGDGITQPGEILVLDKEGKMIVHDVVDDQVAYEHLQTSRDGRPPQPGTMPMPGGPMPGGPMPGGPMPGGQMPGGLAPPGGPGGFDPKIFGGEAPPHGHHP
jgi:hypothetical protein